MTRYQRIARIEQNSDLEIWEAAEYLNGEMGDYYLMWSNPSEYYLVREDDEGNIYVGGGIEELEGDVFEATDEVAQHLEGENYYLVEFPQGSRRLAWIEE